MKIKVFLTALVIILLIFTSCDDFFSTSWGTMRTWHPDQIQITPNNLQDLLRIAAYDPRFADALTQAIIRELGNDPPEPYRTELEKAGITAAIKTSEIGISDLVDNISTILDIISSGEYDGNAENLFFTMLRNLQKNFGQGERAAAHILVILAPTIENNPPEFTKTDHIKNTEAIQAVLLLTLAILDGKEISENPNTLRNDLGLGISGNKITAPRPSIRPPMPGWENEKDGNLSYTLAAYINYFADPANDSIYGEYIRKAFGLN